jgi:hypothetical protein
MDDHQRRTMGATRSLKSELAEIAGLFMDLANGLTDDSRPVE